MQKILKLCSSNFTFFVFGIFGERVVAFVEPFSDSKISELIYASLAIVLGATAGHFIHRRWQSHLLIGLGMVFFLGLMITFVPLLSFAISTWLFGWYTLYIFLFSSGLSGRIILARLTKFELAVGVLVTTMGLIFGDHTPELLIFLLAGWSVLVLAVINVPRTSSLAMFTAASLILVTGYLEHTLLPSKIFESQNQFYDPVIASVKSRQNQLDVTKWRGDKWFYINRQNRWCTLDDWLYHEPMVHPAMGVAANRARVLILGGETGGALKEILKYEDLGKVDLVPPDYSFFKKVHTEKTLKEVAGRAFESDKLVLVDEEIFQFLSQSIARYDVIITDLPDPTSIESNQYYTKEFYELCKNALRDSGVFVTQAGSPYFATKGFYAIVKTIQSSGLDPVTFHNQVLTMGEWGWVMAARNTIGNELKKNLYSEPFGQVATVWFNSDAMKMMLSFGKVTVDTSGIIVNTIGYPTAFSYYQQGNWSL